MPPAFSDASGIMENHLYPRRPAHGDVTKLPTTPRQEAVVALVFFFPFLSLLVFSLRAYSRLKTRQWGVGKSKAGECSDLAVAAF